jgi:hypothetical protein
VRIAGTKLVAKVRSQIRKKSVKGRVACSTELAGCLFDPPKVLSPLLVCSRFIRYRSGLPLVSRGFSAASGMRTKCPPELQSGSGRVLDFYTPTRDTLTLSQGGRMSSQGGSLHHSQQCSARSTRSCALYLGSITVRRACLKLVAKTRRQLRKGSAKGDVTCSTEVSSPLMCVGATQKQTRRCSFVPASFGIKAAFRWSLAAAAQRTACGQSALPIGRAEAIVFSIYTHQHARS